jgi:integrase
VWGSIDHGAGAAPGGLPLGSADQPAGRPPNYFASLRDLRHAHATRLLAAWGPDLYGDLKPGMQEHVAGHADAARQARNEKQ